MAGNRGKPLALQERHKTVDNIRVFIYDQNGCFHDPGSSPGTVGILSGRPGNHDHGIRMQYPVCRYGFQE